MNGNAQTAKKVIVKRSFIRAHPSTLPKKVGAIATEAANMNTFDMMRGLIRRAEEANKLRYKNQTYDVQDICDKAHECTYYTPTP